MAKQHSKKMKPLCLTKYISTQLKLGISEYCAGKEKKLSIRPPTPVMDKKFKVAEGNAVQRPVAPLLFFFASLDTQ